MKRILYGTGNAAKLEGMRRWLEPIGLEVVGLKELSAMVPSVPEDGRTPLENARQKAITYYRTFQMPVFSCDSGLYFDGVPDAEQPGVHVRTVNGKCLSDEEMLEYYAGMAAKYGRLVARYKNAICLVVDEEHIYEAMEKSMESEAFLLASRPHERGIAKKGFPLDCLSIHIESGKYYYDLQEGKLDQVAGEDGFQDFFKRVMAQERVFYETVMETQP